MNWPTGLGTVIALTALVLAIVFVVLGQLNPLVGGFLVALALARLT